MLTLCIILFSALAGHLSTYLYHTWEARDIDNKMDWSYQAGYRMGYLNGLKRMKKIHESDRVHS